MRKAEAEPMLTRAPHRWRSPKAGRVMVRLREGPWLGQQVRKDGLLRMHTVFGLLENP